MTEGNAQPLGRMIYFMAQDIRNLAEKVLAPHELTLEQFQILKILARDANLTQRQLGLETNKNPANLTRILDRLAMKSLIARQPDPNDRRAYHVFLTDKGRALLDEALEVFESFSVRLHQGITGQMQQMTRMVLETMAANIEAMSGELKQDPQ
jgi:DNA-binding MarR family transcriptional regulator